MRCYSFILLALALAAPRAGADEVTITTSKDNTLYQSATGATSNGVGEHFFAGRTAQGSDFLRRGLLAFDVAGAVPAGATITNVTLALTVTMAPVSTLTPQALFRVSSSWGEGTSDAAGQEGRGADATTNDATWVHRFWTGTTWATAGGDFASTASATTDVGGNDIYTWTSTGMIADVQSFLDNPNGNFGWLLRGNEAVALTARRYDTRESTIAENRPALRIAYTPVPEPLGLTALSLALAGLAWRRRATP